MMTSVTTESNGEQLQVNYRYQKMYQQKWTWHITPGQWGVMSIQTLVHKRLMEAPLLCTEVGENRKLLERKNLKGAHGLYVSTTQHSNYHRQKLRVT